MQSKEYIEKYLINEVSSLIETENYFPSLVYATIGIETLGAIIDDKPIRAKNQSKSRFAAALYHLFPNQYGFVNKQNFLYEALRNHSAHNLIPSSKISFINKDDNKTRHLDQKKSQVNFIIEIFAKDFLTACNKAIDMIDNNEAKSKSIAH